MTLLNGVGDAAVDQVAGSAISGNSWVLGDPEAQPLDVTASAMVNAVASASVVKWPLPDHGDSGFCKFISCYSMEPVKLSIEQEALARTVALR